MDRAALGERIILVVMFLWSGALMVILGVPMMKRRVRPNGVYGLRTPATLSDEWVWYEANARCGREFVGLGMAVVVLTLALAFVPGVPAEAYALSLVAALVGGVLVVAVRGWRHANRLLHLRRREQEQGS